MSFIDKEFARLAFQNSCSALALKNYLGMFVLKMTSYFASVIFGVGFVFTFWNSPY